MHPANASCATYLYGEVGREEEEEEGGKKRKTDRVKLKHRLEKERSQADQDGQRK